MGARKVVLLEEDGLWDVECRHPNCGFYRGGYEKRKRAAKVRIRHEADHRKKRRLAVKISKV